MAGTLVFDKWQNGDGTENYKCRAWVNFNGTGTVAIRASGNVSSITDNGTGDYTVNFTTAMSDANYSISVATSKSDSNTDGNSIASSGTTTLLPTISTCRVFSAFLTGSAVVAKVDTPQFNVSIFR